MNQVERVFLKFKGLHEMTKTGLGKILHSIQSPEFRYLHVYINIRKVNDILLDKNKFSFLEFKRQIKSIVAVFILIIKCSCNN